MTIEHWKYDDFVKANNGRFSALDFIHAVTAKVALPSDFALCMARLFAPKMTLFDNVIVVADWFDEARYEEYRRSGMKPEQAQAWVNMVELTDIFQGISSGQAQQLAVVITGLWDEIISHNFPNTATRASVIFEEDTDEVFVTIGRFSEA
ncbi:hypothetical protein [Paraburkholderia lycopersici]|uniref:hypothetical protein n=1 Tax=Paraburkholderia lycopersici TaxID=416944 RepID=UPI000B8347A7|nr:hypothetical protein [Paraburkholderia lycopersici]